MTPQLWIAVLGGICTVLVSFATWGFATGKFSSQTEAKAQKLAEQLHEYKQETTRRFDEAGKATSEAWTYVQGLESRIQRDFAPRELMDERFSQSTEDRRLLRAELVVLKAEQGELWKYVHDRRIDRQA